MAHDWFYTRDGKQKHGPVSSTQLQTLARSGQLLPSDRLWKQGMSQWVPAAKVKGLFPSPATPPPLPREREEPLEVVPEELPAEHAACELVQRRVVREGLIGQHHEERMLLPRLLGRRLIGPGLPPGRLPGEHLDRHVASLTRDRELLDVVVAERDDNVG